MYTSGVRKVKVRKKSCPVNKYEIGGTVRQLHVLQTSLLSTGARSPARRNPGQNFRTPWKRNRVRPIQINLDKLVAKKKFSTPAANSVPIL